jgi:hypothetical protein
MSGNVYPVPDETPVINPRRDIDWRKTTNKEMVELSQKVQKAREVLDEATAKSKAAKEAADAAKREFNVAKDNLEVAEGELLVNVRGNLPYIPHL